MIKILRDICLEQPTFNKVTEMCVRMIRRVNDEEGIKVGDLNTLVCPCCGHVDCDMYLFNTDKEHGIVLLGNMCPNNRLPWNKAVFTLSEYLLCEC